MKTFREYLIEARQAPLYHATPLMRFDDIIKANTLFAFTTQSIKSDQPQKGVSLTRSLKFAKGWQPIIFQFDQQKLTNNHKIIPIDYFSTGAYAPDSPYYDPDLDKRRSEKDGTAEAEEFVVGPIKNLKRYVTKIYFRPKGLSQASLELVKSAADSWKIPLELF